jgi:predicted nuclease with TOPRIM domain
MEQNRAHLRTECQMLKAEKTVLLNRALDLGRKNADLKTRNDDLKRHSVDTHQLQMSRKNDELTAELKKSRQELATLKQQHTRLNEKLRDEGVKITDMKQEIFLLRKWHEMPALSAKRHRIASA